MGGTDPFLLWLQGLATPWADYLMGAASYLGTEFFYLAALSILYWCVDARGTFRLAVILFSSVYLHEAVKEITALPRPFEVDPNIHARFKSLATGYAFPSGHAQDAVVFWGYLAMVIRRWWIYIVAPIVILLIALSRLYLGVHWTRDVLAGLLFGLIILGFAYVILRLLAGMPLQARFPATLVLCLLPLIFFFLFPAHGGAQSMGALFGAALGYQVERRYLRFAVRRPPWQQALKLVIGLAGALLLYVGLRAVLVPPSLPEAVRMPTEAYPSLAGEFLHGWGQEIPTFIRYALLGVWGTLIAPLLFRALFGREEEPPATA